MVRGLEKGKKNRITPNPPKAEGSQSPLIFFGFELPPKGGKIGYRVRGYHFSF